MPTNPAHQIRIPGYRIERQIARGGMATVYLAEQLSLGRRVALKVLDPVLAADPGFVERFVAEARLLASMRNRHILAIHDVGVHAGAPYLALEYFERGSVLERCGSLSEVDVLHCVRDVAMALAHVHAARILHRDVKPENVFQHDDDSFVLADFGIARLQGDGSRGTVAGLTLGTPHYMAPERWTNTVLDGRADLYSLGAMLHMLATGEVPYPGDDPLAIAAQHAHAPTPQLPAQFSRLQGLLARLMAKAREDRPPDAAAVVAHVQSLLREIAQSEAARPSPPRASTSRVLKEWPFGGSERVVEPVRPWWRQRVATPIAAALLLTCSIGVWSYLREPSTHEVAATAAAMLARPANPRIAVMPFQVRADDNDLVQLASVLGQDLTTELARHPALKVAAHTSVVALAQKKLGVGELGVQLKVDYLLEGSLRRREDSIEVAVQLVNAGTGYQDWSETLVGSQARFWELERDMTGRIARALLPAAAPAPSAGPAQVPGSGVAFGSYLKGRQLLISGNSDAVLASAVGQFESALTQSPDFAQARAALCQAELRRFELSREAAAFDRARSACETAVSADAQSGEVLLALGDLYRVRGDAARAIVFYQRLLADPVVRNEALTGLAKATAAIGDAAVAERYFREALAAQPGYWRGHYDLANFQLVRGRPDDAIDNYRAALALSASPEPSVYNNLGSAYLMSDRFEEASDAYAASLKIAPNRSALSNMGLIRMFLRDYPGAVEYLRQATSANPDDDRVHGNLADALTLANADPSEIAQHYRIAASHAERYLATKTDSAEVSANLAWYWANLGETEKARVLLAAIATRPVDDGETAYRLALAYVRIGDQASARIWLERAQQRKFSPRIISSTPWLAELLQLPPR